MSKTPRKTFEHTLRATLRATHGWGAIRQFVVECKQINDSDCRVAVALINMPAGIRERIEAIKQSDKLPVFEVMIDVEITQAGNLVGEIIIANWSPAAPHESDGA